MGGHSYLIGYKACKLNGDLLLLYGMSAGARMVNENVVVSIPPLHYIHVLDKNTNTTKLVTGPATYNRKDQETYVQ